MKPDEFDEVFKNKINQLTQIPGLDCTDDHIWQRVKVKMSGGITGIFTSVIVVLLVMLGIYWALRPNDADPVRAPQIPAPPSLLEPKQPTAQPVIHPEKHPKQALAPQVRSIQASSPKKLRAKKVSLPKEQIAVLPLVDTTERALKLPLNTSQLHSLAVDQPPASRPVLKLNDALPIMTEVEKKLSNAESPTTQEGYFRLASDGMYAGHRWVKLLSPRVSIAYGLTFKQAFQTIEGRPAFQSLAPELPLELRYYLLPKENRFTAFVYTQVRPSFASGAVRFEVGTQAQYRLWQSSRGASYLGVRLPLYQTSINPAWSSRPYPHALVPTR